MQSTTGGVPGGGFGRDDDDDDASFDDKTIVNPTPLGSRAGAAQIAADSFDEATLVKPVSQRAHAPIPLVLSARRPAGAPGESKAGAGLERPGSRPPSAGGGFVPRAPQRDLLELMGGPLVTPAVREQGQGGPSEPLGPVPEAMSSVLLPPVAAPPPPSVPVPPEPVPVIAAPAQRASDSSLAEFLPAPSEPPRRGDEARPSAPPVGTVIPVIPAAPPVPQIVEPASFEAGPTPTGRGEAPSAPAARPPASMTQMARAAPTIVAVRRSRGGSMWRSVFIGFACILLAAALGLGLGRLAAQRGPDTKGAAGAVAPR